ncbi:nitroreductase family protein [uncultured Slackia sp.]|uniref:nitroreductase family protein n=1 Tax=uncultured Slackia sp. TaxID=665903 RepID=UPI0026DF4F54|nr:nitroreductase family protein [uncultured Slackia sp.]
MDIMQAIEHRRSVRKYSNAPIDPAAVERLERIIAHCNAEGGLRFQLCLNDPAPFASRLATYGMFEGVSDYVALVGEKGPLLEEKVGYYGELVALGAQMAGLNTCWVALTYRKKALSATIADGEACPCVLALGYGLDQGFPRKTKPVGKLCRSDRDPLPDWFAAGMKAAQLAPTALNQQRFLITLENEAVQAVALAAPCANIDLGIVKRHFELGARSVRPDWDWK